MYGSFDDKAQSAWAEYKEMHQSIEEKRKKIKSLQKAGHPASILIKQVKDHG